MDSLLQLHLQADNPKPEEQKLSKSENDEPKPIATSKRLNKIVNRAAHKGASQYGRNSSGIFSK